MTYWLVVDVGCAECRGGPGYPDPSLIDRTAVVADVDQARELALRWAAERDPKDPRPGPLQMRSRYADDEVVPGELIWFTDGRIEIIPVEVPS